MIKTRAYEVLKYRPVKVMLNLSKTILVEVGVGLFLRLFE